MTEPISRDPLRSVRAHEDDESKSSPPEAASRPAAQSSAQLASHAPPDWERIPTSSGEDAAAAARNATPSGRGQGASSNASRTTERDFTRGPYAAAGATHDGGSYFAGVAALKGRTSEGIEGEALSVSIQVGQQNEAQATVARLGYGGRAVSGSVEAFTANAHAGLEGSDGSRGVNMGIGANLAAAEVTVKHSGWSVTAGLSAGAGVEGHVGLRDDDKDGKPELCLRFGAAWGLGGVCLESPVVIRP